MSAVGLPLEACATVLVPDMALTQTPSEYQLDLSKFRDVAGKYSYVPGEAYQCMYNVSDIQYSQLTL